MKTRNFCGLIVGIAALVFGFSSPLIAGGAPAVQTVQGGPIPASTRNDYGNPIQGSSGGLQTSSSSGSVPSSNTGGSVPGGNYYGGNNDTATSSVRERGVAGSGLPREKVSVVDSKSLRSSKTDGKFDTSLLGADFKSVKDVKAATQKDASKSQSQTEKATSSAKTSEQSKTQTSTSGDSTKAPETTTSGKR